MLKTPKVGFWMYSRVYLLYVSVVGSTDKLFQLCQTVRFRQSKDQLRLHVRFSGFLSSHLQKLDQIFPVIYKKEKNLSSATQTTNKCKA